MQQKSDYIKLSNVDYYCLDFLSKHKLVYKGNNINQTPNETDLRKSIAEKCGGLPTNFIASHIQPLIDSNLIRSQKKPATYILTNEGQVVIERLNVFIDFYGSISESIILDKNKGYEVLEFTENQRPYVDLNMESQPETWPPLEIMNIDINGSLYLPNSDDVDTELQKKLEKSEQQIKLQDDEIRRLKIELEQSNEKNIKLDTLYSNTEKIIIKMDHDNKIVIDKLKKDNTALIKQNESLTNKIKAIENKSISENSQKDAEILRLKVTIRDLTAQQKLEKTENDKLLIKIKDLEQKTIEAQTTAMEVEEQFTVQYMTNEKLTQQNQQLVQDLKIKNSEITGLESQNKLLITETLDLKDAFEKQHQEIQEPKSQLAQLQTQLPSQNTSFDTRLKKRKELEENNNETQLSDKEYGEKKRKLAEVFKQSDELKETLDKIDSKQQLKALDKVAETMALNLPLTELSFSSLAKLINYIAVWIASDTEISKLFCQDQKKVAFFKEILRALKSNLEGSPVSKNARATLGAFGLLIAALKRLTNFISILGADNKFYELMYKKIQAELSGVLGNVGENIVAFYYLHNFLEFATMFTVKIDYDFLHTWCKVASLSITHEFNKKEYDLKEFAYKNILLLLSKISGDMKEKLSVFLCAWVSQFPKFKNRFLETHLLSHCFALEHLGFRQDLFKGARKDKTDDINQFTRFYIDLAAQITNKERYFNFEQMIDITHAFCSFCDDKNGLPELENERNEIINHLLKKLSQKFNGCSESFEIDNDKVIKLRNILFYCSLTNINIKNYSIARHEILNHLEQSAGDDELILKIVEEHLQYKLPAPYKGNEIDTYIPLSYVYKDKSGKTVAIRIIGDDNYYPVSNSFQGNVSFETRLLEKKAIKVVNISHRVIYERVPANCNLLKKAVQPLRADVGYRNNPETKFFSKPLPYDHRYEDKKEKYPKHRHDDDVRDEDNRRTDGKERKNSRY